MYISNVYIKTINVYIKRVYQNNKCISNVPNILRKEIDRETHY